MVGGALLALLSATVAGGITPLIAADLRVPDTAVAAATTAFLLASAFGIAVSAWLGARTGGRAGWLTALALFAVGSAACALAPDITTLCVARVVQGAGGGALEPMMFAAIARVTPRASLGRALGAAGAVVSTGPLIGPILGGAGAEIAGWRAVFAAIAGCATLTLLASARLVPRVPPARVKLDVVGLGTLAAGTSSTLLGLSIIASPHVREGVILILAGAVALLVYVRNARRSGPQAILDVATLEHRGFAPTLAIMVLLGGAVYPVIFGIPQIIAARLQSSSEAMSGLLTAPLGVGLLVAVPLASALSDRVAARRIITVAAMVATTALGCLSLSGRAPLILGIALIALIGASIGSVGSPAFATAYRVLPRQLQPAGTATLFIANQLGGATGIALIALISAAAGTSATGSSTVPLWIAGAATVCISMIATRLPD